MVTCRQLVKDIAGGEWTLGDLTRISAEYFWTWLETDTIGYDGNYYLVWYKYINFERYFWFELGNCIWRKHRSVYQDHMEYFCNDIVKPFNSKFSAIPSVYMICTT